MIFRYFFRALRDTIKNIFRSPIYSLINILTIGSMLFVLACVFVISVNMNSILDDVAGRLEVVAFYEYDAGESDMEQIEQELLIDGFCSQRGPYHKSRGIGVHERGMG